MCSYRAEGRAGRGFCLTDLNPSVSALWELLCALGLLKSSASHWEAELLFFPGILMLDGKVFSFRSPPAWLLWICHQNEAFFTVFSRIFSRRCCIAKLPHPSSGSQLSAPQVEVLAWGNLGNSSSIESWPLSYFPDLKHVFWWDSGQFRLALPGGGKRKSGGTKPNLCKSFWMCFHPTGQGGFGRAEILSLMGLKR